MEKFYSIERNVQMLIYLMKQHGVRKVVASPGATNICFVASVQFDPYFEVYSAADERSAAYIACGLAAESGEPVALSCTGATASRNYVPGLTEAFYRKLPVLAVTATQHTGRIGQNIPQVIDRRVQFNDLVRYSLQLPTIHDSDDEWAYGVKINEALLALQECGGGPVHINLTTKYSKDFSVRELKPVKVIKRITTADKFPVLEGKRIGIFVGAHRAWSKDLTKAVDAFCAAYDAAVFCDHTSNYLGAYRVDFSLVFQQALYSSPLATVDLMIDMGDISGAYAQPKAKEVWRVNPDGAVRDTYQKLTKVFAMTEQEFFQHYAAMKEAVADGHYAADCRGEYQRILDKMPELPFSNAWLAQQTCARLPENSVLHLGILNTLRTWNFYQAPKTVRGYANTGGFGIDGCVSTLLGASLADRQSLYFGVFGDLAFFYDMNSLGNRHVGANLRIILVNNGRGTEFRNYNHPAARFGEDADPFMAAAGHYGRQSDMLVRHYAEDLGFEYLCAHTKEEYNRQLDRFLSSELTDRPMLLEVFTDSKDESDALYAIYHIEHSVKGEAKGKVRKVLGDKGVAAVKKLLGR